MKVLRHIVFVAGWFGLALRAAHGLEPLQNEGQLGQTPSEILTETQVELGKIISPLKERQLRERLPEVQSKKWRKLLSDPSLIFYTEDEMPRCYQDWDGALNGVFSAHYNISANGAEPHGNGNIEFPWGTPAGTHRSPNVDTFRFLQLPRNDEGKRIPIIWYMKRLPGDHSSSYQWLFPVGTVFGEVLSMKSPSGDWLTFEIRLRIRERDAWAVDVLRPFPTTASLARRIQQLRPEWQQDESLVAAVRQLTDPIELVRHRLVSAHPNQKVFEDRMGVDRLPTLNDDRLVEELLIKTPFQSVLGETWRQGTNGIVAAAPTTRADFHIVPRNYDAGFVSLDRESCMRCHETVSQHVRRFEFGRDWYGRIRGADGIFSFHPFSLRSISYNGYGHSVTMRSEFVNAGLLVPHDPNVHTKDLYNPIVELERKLMNTQY